MTKLPETISKKVNVFNGCELGTVPKFQPANRCVGGTTAVALELLGKAQLDGAAFGFDYSNYDMSRSFSGANQLLSNLTELVDKLGFDGFSFKVMTVESTRGLKGIPTQAIASTCVDAKREYGVAVFFDPIVEVFYDLRK